MTLDPATSRESVVGQQQQQQQQHQSATNQQEAQNVPQSENQTKPIVGIIYPPPEHRNIIDKTAMFVARNGPEFEEKVRQNEISNSKFNFFNATDPYHAYYQHKIKEFREGKALEPTVPQKPTLPSAVQAQQEKIKQQIAAESAVPKEAPPDYEFTADPPSISGLELDIVKLTAQFVARNGRHFLTQLMNREQRNPQFDFLRPQHGMFQYFTKLVEQYTKVLIPPKDLVEMLERQSISMNPMVEEVKRRAEWRKHVEKQKQKAADEQEKERVAYAQIDWHDFVIVETVDFQPHETLGLPPPVTPATVGARVIHQQRLDEKKRLGIEDEGKDDANDPSAAQSQNREGAEDDEEAGGADMDLEDMEESDEEPLEDEAEDDDSQEGLPQPSTSQPAIQPVPTGGEDLLIRKDYDPKMRAGQSGIGGQVPKYFVNEMTGEKIPLDEVNKHVKYNLLDPRWLEEKERQQREKQQQEEVFAIGNQIGDSLKQLAERRTDIFGAGDEETLIGRKLGEEENVNKRDERAIWDGHTASVESTTKRIQANITIQDQIDAIHKAKGLAEDSSKEKIGPQLGSDTSATESLATTSQSEVSQMKTSSVQPAGVPQISVRPPVATPLIVPMVPVVQRPPVVPVFNPNPGAASMLGAQAALLRPTVAGLAIQQQNLAVAALAAQQQVVAAAQANAEKTAQAQAAAAAAAGTLTHAMTKQASSSSNVNQPSSAGDAQQSDDGPPAKKQKTEADLIPEAVFLQSCTSSSVTIRVSVPVDYSKPEWNLKGQTLKVTLPYKDFVSVIKEKVFEQIALPAGKQKLVFDGMFIKDSNTLAFYNILNDALVGLQLKERGGRKK